MKMGEVMRRWNEAKCLNMAQGVWIHRFHHVLLAASGAMRRGKKSILIRWIGRNSLPTSSSMPHLWTGSRVALRDEHETNR